MELADTPDSNPGAERRESSSLSVGTMTQGKKKELIPMVALLAVNGVEVKTFERAWVRALELPRPVRISFIGFVRKD